MSGSAEVTIEVSTLVGSVGSGETAGELSLINADHPHAATITASENLEAAVLDHDALTQLVRQRPDIGVIIYRNLGAQLGEKLLRANRELANLACSQRASLPDSPRLAKPDSR